jgi:hypothetical protein
MVHPPPSHVAVAVCPECGRVSLARHVNREDEIPARFCRFDATRLDVSLYAHERELPRAPPP